MTERTLVSLAVSAALVSLDLDQALERLAVLLSAVGGGIGPPRHGGGVRSARSGYVVPMRALVVEDAASWKASVFGGLWCRGEVDVVDYGLGPTALCLSRDVLAASESHLTGVNSDWPTPRATPLGAIERWQRTGNSQIVFTVV